MSGGNWVVLIAGSTGSALRAVRPPNLHITPVVEHDSFTPRCNGFLVAGSPLAIIAQGHPGDLLVERDGGNLRWPPRQQCCEPGPMLGAMDLGMAVDGERASNNRPRR